MGCRLRHPEMLIYVDPACTHPNWAQRRNVSLKCEYWATKSKKNLSKWGAVNGTPKCSHILACLDTSKLNSKAKSKSEPASSRRYQHPACLDSLHQTCTHSDLLTHTFTMNTEPTCFFRTPVSFTCSLLPLHRHPRLSLKYGEAPCLRLNTTTRDNYSVPEVVTEAPTEPQTPLLVPSSPSIVSGYILPRESSLGFEKPTFRFHQARFFKLVLRALILHCGITCGIGLRSHIFRGSSRLRWGCGN